MVFSSLSSNRRNVLTKDHQKSQFAQHAHCYSKQFTTLHVYTVIYMYNATLHVLQHVQIHVHIVHVDLVQ